MVHDSNFSFLNQKLFKALKNHESQFKVCSLVVSNLHSEFKSFGSNPFKIYV